MVVERISDELRKVKKGKFILQEEFSVKRNHQESF